MPDGEPAQHGRAGGGPAQRSRADGCADGRLVRLRWRGAQIRENLGNPARRPRRRTQSDGWTAGHQSEGGPDPAGQMGGRQPVGRTRRRLGGVGRAGRTQPDRRAAGSRSDGRLFRPTRSGGQAVGQTRRRGARLSEGRRAGQTARRAPSTPRPTAALDDAGQTPGLTPDSDAVEWRRLSPTKFAVLLGLLRVPRAIVPVPLQAFIRITAKHRK